jgi:phosphatidylserine/phosphatidylglycerophosphate/cardiolipin synthase-like enzyme
VTLSTHPNQTAALVDRAVAAVSSRLRLANSGETIRLLRNGTVVDETSYTSAAEGEIYNATAQRWRPLGATDRPVVTAGSGSVEAFVLPDERERAVEFLNSATDRVLLAGYTFASERAVEALSRAIERGVTVDVLVDGSPIGGMTGRQAAALDELARASANVRVVAGERTWYRYHHAKYAVVDERALVTTENWKPAGTGGASSRGWAVITDQRPIVAGLVETFRADSGRNDTRSWREHEPELTAGEPATGEYPRAFEARSVPVEQTHLLVAPDNAEAEILDRIERAEDSVDVLQVTVGDRGLPFLQAVLDAAARGVEVQVLLSGAWYVREENRQLVAWLEEQAAAANLSLSARVAEPGGAFEKIHAKGVIIDDREVILGSINWNNNSVRNNREVALVLEGEAVATYFGDVFEADWRGDDGGGRRLPLGLALACLLGAVLAVLGARRIRFGGRGR